ncbi:MAG TPA: ATP cone domain-containing protein, partial [Thermoleophilia bacterium]|nr:ATP cone domain-containing protein [Thermoleophilia bacterium]
MRCAYCKRGDTRVVDSRDSEGQDAVRRRRECMACGQRFTTYEKVEEPAIRVAKRDGTVEEFRPEKLLQGVVRACTKREVPLTLLEDLVADIEGELRARADYE